MVGTGWKVWCDRGTSERARKDGEGTMEAMREMERGGSILHAYMLHVTEGFGDKSRQE
jgi:hypothetical protein